MSHAFVGMHHTPDLHGMQPPDKKSMFVPHGKVCTKNYPGLQGMKALWGRKVSDLGFASFVDILHHVAQKTGVLVQHVGRWFPSTKRCSACGHVNEHITLRDRVWTCVACKTTHRRDLNAAINLDQEGASSCGGHPVSLASASLDG